MNLPKFKYLAPNSLKEACEALKEYNGLIGICAGGTELVMHLKWGLKAPDYLLSLKNLIELRKLRYDDNLGFVLGAMVSLRNLAGSAHIKSELVALSEAAEAVASPQIRNMATIGGNVSLDTRCWYYDRSKQWRTTFPPCYKDGGAHCYMVKGGKQCYALFMADTVPSLLILRAKLKLVHSDGEYILPIEEFYTGLGKTPNRMNKDEILTEINIPKLPPYSGTVYLKYSNRAVLNFPVIGFASLVRLNGEGKFCQEARFALTGIKSKPILIDATKLLKGLDEPSLNEDQIKYLLQEVRPITHMGVSSSLKRIIIRVLLRKAFHDSWRMAQKSRTDSFSMRK